MLHSADLNKLLICNDLFYLLFQSLKFGQGPSPETVGRHQKQFPTAYLSSKGQKGDRRPLPLTVGEGCCGGGVGDSNNRTQIIRLSHTHTRKDHNDTHNPLTLSRGASPL